MKIYILSNCLRYKITEEFQEWLQNVNVMRKWEEMFKQGTSMATVPNIRLYGLKIDLSFNTSDMEAY